MRRAFLHSNTWDLLPIHYPCHLISYPCQHTSSSAKIPIQLFFPGLEEHFSIQYMRFFAGTLSLPSQILPMPTYIIFSQDPIQPFFPGCGEHFSIQYIGSFANALPLPSHILPLPTHIIFSQDPHPALLSWMWGAFLHSIHRIICQ